MSQHPSDGEQQNIEIVFELPPSPQGTYRLERSDGTTVRGDASGEWTLDEDGEVDDVVFFVSPGWVRDLEQRDLLNRKPPEVDGSARRLALPSATGPSPSRRGSGVPWPHVCAREKVAGVREGCE